MVFAEHCSTLACDHISEACEAAFADSAAATHYRMHPTKCTEMINDRLAPYFIQKLGDGVGDQKYGLLPDESTDISAKYRDVLVRYFN